MFAFPFWLVGYLTQTLTFNTFCMSQPHENILYLSRKVPTALQKKFESTMWNFVFFQYYWLCRLFCVLLKGEILISDNALVVSELFLTYLFLKCINYLKWVVQQKIFQVHLRTAYKSQILHTLFPHLLHFCKFHHTLLQF